MGLMANIPAIEAAQALSIAQGVAIALGNEKLLAKTIYDSTGNARLAQKIEVQARMERHLNG